MALLAWYYNSNTGAVEDLPVPAGDILLHTGLGWHGPFDSQQAANDFYRNGAAANPGWKAPTGLAGILGNAGNAVTQPVTDVTSAITAATNTAVKLSLRFAEIAVGVVLLAVAANAILKQTTGVDVAGSAARTGKKAGKVAATAAVL